MNTAQIEAALRERYSGQEWAYLPQVRNGTGFVRNARTADALAMSLWPSRGLELHGFEVKASRADWKRELESPAKAEEICRFCDRWWVVAGSEDIVAPGELPPTWGLLLPRGKGLVAKKDAPKLEPQPITKLFLAAMLRQASACVVPEVATQEALSRKFEEGYKVGQTNKQRETDIANKEVKRLQDTIDAFEAASGVRIRQWDAGRIGEAVRTLTQHGKAADLVAQAKQEIEHLRRRADFLEAELPALEPLAAEGDLTRS